MPAFHDEVDAEPADPVLDFDPVASGDEPTVDVPFEVGVEAVLHSAGGVAFAAVR